MDRQANPSDEETHEIQVFMDVYPIKAQGVLCYVFMSSVCLGLECNQVDLRGSEQPNRKYAGTNAIAHENAGTVLFKPSGQVTCSDIGNIVRQ